MNELTIRALCSNLIEDEILARALTFKLAILHSPSTCSSKVRLASIFSPKGFHCTYLTASHYKYSSDECFYY